MSLHVVLITLGALFLVGLATDAVGRLTGLPRVTLLMLFGVLIGPVGLDVLPSAVADWYEFLAAAALSMVAFILGGALTLDKLRRRGRQIAIVSISVVLATVVVVGLGLAAVGVALAPALALAGIATATDPAATQDVVQESGASGSFSDVLLGIVAIDDAWGLIAFSLMVVVAKGALDGGALMHVAAVGREIGGAVLIGLLTGLPAALLTGRLRDGVPLMLEILGVVLLTAGVAIWAHVSYLLAGMVAGVVVANLASEHTRAFQEAEHVEWPFMVLFFVLAGASLEIANLMPIALLLAAYVVLRVVGRVLGGWIGAVVAGGSPAELRWMGLALMPQAGVAVGMALVAADQFPESRELILSVTVAATVLFEIGGPVMTRLVLRRVGEAAARGG